MKTSKEIVNRIFSDMIIHGTDSVQKNKQMYLDLCEDTVLITDTEMDCLEDEILENIAEQTCEKCQGDAIGHDGNSGLYECFTCDHTWM
jgi:predicted methyltransferase